MFRTLFAAFAVLINTVFPAGWSFAAATADPLGRAYVVCLASGGPMPAASDQRTPANTDREDLHCQLCRLPAPTAVQIPLPVATSILVRIAVAIRFLSAQHQIQSIDIASSFEARAPPA